MNPKRGEAGYTLSEVLIAVVILAVAITTIVGAMGSSIFSSRVHRDIVTSDAVVRAYAEQLNAAAYVPCANTTTAPYPAMAGAPTGFTGSVIAVKYWDGAPTNAANYVTTCPAAGDQGLQLVSIRAQRAGGAGFQTMQFVKRQP